MGKQRRISDEQHLAIGLTCELLATIRDGLPIAVVLAAAADFLAITIKSGTAEATERRRLFDTLCADLEHRPRD
jgi:hypothetical protein